MDWPEITLVFWVSHLVGDFLLQTDWQALNKHGDSGSPWVSRRALLSHVSVYTLCFVPALIWIRDDISALGAVGLAAVIFIPHLVIDDGRLVRLYMVRVKRSPDPPPSGLSLAVDQSLHLICLWGTALLALA